MGPDRLKRHIILVGLPGAGKTTVGKLVAAELSAAFVDLDHAIEDRAGKTIGRLFAEDGEARFRALERAEMDTALAAPPGVIAAGGGWAAQPGNLASVAERGFTVYLRVAPEVAAARLGRPEAGGHLMAGSRPLLAGGDVQGRIQQLLSARRLSYERCHAVLPGDEGDATAVAREVVALARSLAGWY